MENKKLEKKNAPVDLNEDALDAITGGKGQEIIMKNDTIFGVNTSEDVGTEGGTMLPPDTMDRG